LAKELGMTVSRLCAEMSQEELVGWAAFLALRAEEEEKAMERAKTRSRAGSMHGK
jgi:hypothetical protein